MPPPRLQRQSANTRLLAPASSDETMILGQGPAHTRDVTPEHLVKKRMRMKFEGDDASVTVPSMSESESAAAQPSMEKKPADPAGQTTYVQKRPATAVKSGPTAKGKSSKSAAKGNVSKKPAAKGILKKPAGSAPCTV